MFGAGDTLENSNQTAAEFLIRHQSGEWGDVCEDNRQKMSYQSNKAIAFFHPIERQKM
jgi:hypothetical protein